MFEQFSISNIIDSVGNSKQKRITMLILLFFALVYMGTNNYFEKSDCSELIKQNEHILKNNYTLTKLNNSLITDNGILVYKIDSLQKQKVDKKTITKILEKLVIKNDTIYIQNNLDYYNINRIETSRSFDFFDSTDIDTIDY